MIFWMILDHIPHSKSLAILVILEVFLDTHLINFGGFLFFVFCFGFQTQGSSKSGGGESTDSGSAVNTLSSRAEGQLEPESPISIKPTSDHHQPFDQKNLQFQQNQHHQHQHQHQLEMASDNNPRLAGPSESQPAAAAASKPPPEKVLYS